MRKLIILAVFVAGAVILAACGGSPTPQPVSANPTVPADFAGKSLPAGADAAAGKEVFTTNCAACHGAEGHGDGPAGAALDPKPRDLSAFAPEVGDDYLFWRVNTGVPGTAMVGWKGILTDEQIWDVIAYIRTLK